MTGRSGGGGQPRSTVLKHFATLAAPRIVTAAFLVLNLFAAEQHGVVMYSGVPVPGATVTASQGDKKLSGITDANGSYSFAELTDGTWTVQVEMPGFATLKREVAVRGQSAAAAQTWELEMLPFEQIHAEAQLAMRPQAIESAATAAADGPKTPEGSRKTEETQPPREDLAERAEDGLLINGSQNNSASSPFALFPAFGNNRNGSRSLYNGGFGISDDNSIFDARPFSLTGQNTPKPSYNHLSASVFFGGPIKIPHLIRNGPNFFVNYTWTRNRTNNIGTALMPTAAERAGNLSQVPAPILNPLTGAPFSGNHIPTGMISPQAQALLSLYPLPNFTGPGAYNYQVPLIGATHQDSLQSRLNRTFGMRNSVYGGFAFQDTRQSSPNVFGFLDASRGLGLTANASWFHRFVQGMYGTFGYRFSRFSMDLTPSFANRENVSGAAGISGNDQSAANWGPPGLNFSSGIAALADAEQSITHNETNALSASMFWRRGRHNLHFGGDYTRQQFNSLGQQNGRGVFTFDGAASGSAFADFLLGIPDAAAVAYGNADKYFRGALYDAFFTDDWRISPSFTLNAGVRWEYGLPLTELYGRLVNLDVVPGFVNEAPVIASSPVGALTGQRYPSSLLHPYRGAVEPRVAIAWRPIPASSLVIRAGYGVYYDTSIYETVAAQMSQQFPLSKSLSVQNTPATPLTLAQGFNTQPLSTPNTFGIDPAFRPGYAQTWQASVQRDLPGSLVLIATYSGIKGTHGTQEFLPNTYPTPAMNPCPACPAGYLYVTSNGNSTREAGQIQLRRRLHSGFTATLQYTFAKAIDNDAVVGGLGAAASSPVASAAPGAAAASTVRNLLVAQNWLNLSAERSLSAFDQRHVLSTSIQYTTGMGMAGGTLLSGWRGRLLKGWMLQSTVSAGSGLPLTPTFLAPVAGTGVTNALRPEYTGAPLYDAPSGLALNPAAYAPPPPGEFGNAGRYSIIGPAQFTLNASAGRTFQLTDRLSGDLRIESANPINHVTFTGWNTIYGNAQFGLPFGANPMRSVTTGFVVRF